MTAEPPIDPVAALLALTDAAVRRQPVAASVAVWLTRGVKAYLNGDLPLDRALGLRGSHWPGSTRFRYSERNRYLAEASRLLGGDPGALAAEINAFETRTWPRWRHLGSPPETATGLQRALFAAFKTQAPVPSSGRHLRRIVTGGE